MEEFLRQQPIKTLEDWLIDHRVKYTDPINDIVHYYRYLDALLIPSNTSYEALYLNEVLSCIISKCYSNVLKSFSCVCKQWNKVALTMMDNNITYPADAARCTDWYHLAKSTQLISVEEANQCVIEMAKQGYRLNLPNTTASGQLCIHVVEKDTNRHFNIFCEDLEHFKNDPSRFEGGYEAYCANDDANRVFPEDTATVFSLIFCECVRANNLRSFKYAYSELIPHLFLPPLLRDVMGYLGRVEMLEFVFNDDMISESAECFLEGWQQWMNDIIVCAYCGGHYDSVLEFSTKIPDYEPIGWNGILDTIMERHESRIFCPKTLLLLIDLLGQTDNELTSTVYNVASLAEHTIDHLIKFWDMVEERVDCDIVSRIAPFINNKRYDDVLWLIESGRVVIDEVEVGSLKNECNEIGREWIDTNL